MSDLEIRFLATWALTVFVNLILLAAAIGQHPRHVERTLAGGLVILGAIMVVYLYAKIWTYAV